MAHASSEGDQTEGVRPGFGVKERTESIDFCLVALLGRNNGAPVVSS